MAKPLYEVGRYACKVTSQALGEAKTGTPQFVLQFTVLGKVDPSDPTRYIPAAAQYERTHFRAITDKTIKYFFEDLKILGFKGSSFRELDPNTPGFHDFRGLDVDMWCSHEDDQDGGKREHPKGAREQPGAVVGSRVTARAQRAQDARSEERGDQKRHQERQGVHSPKLAA